MFKVKTAQYTKVVGYIAEIGNFNIGRKSEQEVRVPVTV